MQLKVRRMAQLSGESTLRNPPMSPWAGRLHRQQQQARPQRQRRAARRGASGRCLQQRRLTASKPAMATRRSALQRRSGACRSDSLISGHVTVESGKQAGSCLYRTAIPFWEGAADIVFQQRCGSWPNCGILPSHNSPWISHLL